MSKLTSPANAVAGLPGAEKAGLFLLPYRDREVLNFVADRMVYVYGENENTDFVRATRRIAQCPVPPVNAAESGSSTGQESPTLEQEDFRTRFQEMMALNLETSDRVYQLEKSIRFLAEQVKTLIDGLAEDADPDESPTTYMSGKPI